MAIEELSRCPGIPPGESMLKEGDVRGIFALRRRGRGIKAIARELGMAPNTVRYWLRRGEEAPPRPWAAARF